MDKQRETTTVQSQLTTANIIQPSTTCLQSTKPDGSTRSP